MKRKLIPLMLFLVIVAGVVGVAYLSMNGQLPFAKNVPKNGNVLGISQESVKSVVDGIKPAFDRVTGSVSEGVSNVTDTFLVENQKIELDKAIQAAKEKAASIPEEVFERARYDYCSQVVQDFEEKNTE